MFAKKSKNEKIQRSRTNSLIETTAVINDLDMKRARYNPSPNTRNKLS